MPRMSTASLRICPKDIGSSRESSLNWKSENSRGTNNSGVSWAMKMFVFRYMNIISVILCRGFGITDFSSA